MTTYILSGHSKRNEIFLDMALEKFPNAIAIKYDHWESKGKINFDKELSKFDFKDGDLVVCKSIGNVVALKKLKINPAKVRFISFGIPISYCKKIDFDFNELKKFPHKIFQNNEDPKGKASELKGFNLITLRGKTHDYDPRKIDETFL